MEHKFNTELEIDFYVKDSLEKEIQTETRKLEIKLKNIKEDLIYDFNLQSKLNKVLSKNKAEILNRLEKNCNKFNIVNYVYRIDFSNLLKIRRKEPNKNFIISENEGHLYYLFDFESEDKNLLKELIKSRGENLLDELIKVYHTGEEYENIKEFKVFINNFYIKVSIVIKVSSIDEDKDNFTINKYIEIEKILDITNIKVI